jgi:thiosulfate dehydrogenase
MNRAADPAVGRNIFMEKCQRCHSADGSGLLNIDSGSYKYPPLWGQNSFNVSAGMYRLTRLAAFIKYNMPYLPVQVAPQLTDEEAWDAAAFISSQQRPEKFFTYDWGKINTKPVDYPFGPFADSFSAMQHKYGPFTAIDKFKKTHK